MHLLVESDQLVRGTVGLLIADPAYPALDFGHQAYMTVNDQRANASADSSSLESPIGSFLSPGLAVALLLNLINGDVESVHLLRPRLLLVSLIA
jgi:hypothetical protein